jgi:hypothetical protein
MANALMFVCVDTQGCGAMAQPFADAGWETETVSPDAPDALDRIVAEAPVATVFDLDSGHDSAIRALASALISDPNVSRPLLVFVGGTPVVAAELKTDVPFGVFVKPDELIWVLKHLIYHGE